MQTDDTGSETRLYTRSGRGEGDEERSHPTALSHLFEGEREAAPFSHPGSHPNLVEWFTVQQVDTSLLDWAEVKFSRFFRFDTIPDVSQLRLDKAIGRPLHELNGMYAEDLVGINQGDTVPCRLLLALGESESVYIQPSSHLLCVLGQGVPLVHEAVCHDPEATTDGRCHKNVYLHSTDETTVACHPRT